MKIYVASSWRNPDQPDVVTALKLHNHGVYDFRESEGFSWRSIDSYWQNWTRKEYLKGLQHIYADNGFQRDWNAMLAADIGVLVTPCGRSAHLEAGYFVGAKKPLYILLLEQQEPELMYKMATKIVLSTTELIQAIQELEYSIAIQSVS